MTSETENKQDDPEIRKELMEQAAGVLAMHGMQITPEVRALMEPLLDGRMGYEEHQEILQAMMQRLQDG